MGYTENINKSKFFKYWEVSLDDPNLTPEKIAQDYDILFQTSHGEITYSKDVQDKVKAFLNAGGQLWWENCRGLVIESGDGFTEEVEFVSLNPATTISILRFLFWTAKAKCIRCLTIFIELTRIRPPVYGLRVYTTKTVKYQCWETARIGSTMITGILTNCSRMIL